MTPALAIAALIGALAVHAELLARLRLVPTAEPPWWFGYARDGANLSTVFMLWGAYLLVGYATPVALCAAMLTTLGTYLVDWTLASALKVKRVRLALLGPLTAWVALVALAPHWLGATLGSLIAAVQPR